MQHGQKAVSLPCVFHHRTLLRSDRRELGESEFLQMAFYVVLTAFLYQRGSSESKTIGKPANVDRDPRLSRDKPNAPWPVRRGGMAAQGL